MYVQFYLTNCELKQNKKFETVTIPSFLKIMEKVGAKFEIKN